MPNTNVGSAPPRTDYCAFLEHEMNGKKPAFLAGNNAYYYADDDETIGLTHPFWDELKSRGSGIATHDPNEYEGDVASKSVGTGNDYYGWDFHADARVLFGEVHYNSIVHSFPCPDRMYWRPDMMAMEYNLGGAIVREEKFVADNEVISTTITSSEPITIKFDGQSFYREGFSITKNAICEIDAERNLIHVREGGTIETKILPDVVVEGALVYTNMSTVISASKSMNRLTLAHPEAGVCTYSFEVEVDSDGITLSWVMNDDYGVAVDAVQAVVADPESYLTAKTDKMNDLLNDEVPYFRCDDDEVVMVYYYLFALDLMYYTYKGKGQLIYPHTQTAASNFRGSHGYDNEFQARVGAWFANKENYAQGNILIWTMLNGTTVGINGMMPDNLGQFWNSGHGGGWYYHNYPKNAWLIYEHSGDLNFLRQAYDHYKQVLARDDGEYMWGGWSYDGALACGKMALALGYNQSEADWWRGLTSYTDEWIATWLNTAWEGEEEDMCRWGGPSQAMNSFFPANWTKRMANRWMGRGTRDGYFFDGTESEWFLPYHPFETWEEMGLSRTLKKDWNLYLCPNQTESFHDFTGVEEVTSTGAGMYCNTHSWEWSNFAFVPDTTYFYISPLYTKSVSLKIANDATITHLKHYNMRDGIPYAREAMFADMEFFGGAHSNFNAGKLLLILEGIGGLRYSVVDSELKIVEALPIEWASMEFRVPIRPANATETDWSLVRTERSCSASGETIKTITVSANSFDTLTIQPWTEGSEVLSYGAVSTMSTGEQVSAAPEEIDEIAESSGTLGLATFDGSERLSFTFSGDAAKGTVAVTLRLNESDGCPRPPTPGPTTTPDSGAPTPFRFRFTEDTLAQGVAMWLNDSSAAEALLGHVSNWDVSRITDMGSLFESTSFNEDITRYES